MRRFIKFSVCLGILTIGMSAQKTYGQISTIIDVYSGVETVTKVLDGMGAIIGSTKVTPKYWLNDWVNDYQAWSWDATGSPSYYYRDYYYVYADNIILRYFYDHETYTYDGTTFNATYDENNAFALWSLDRLAYTCDVRPFYYTLMSRDFSICVAVANISKTGQFPPGQPYQTWLKSTVTKLGVDCSDNPSLITQQSTSCNINDTGYTVMRMGWADYNYDWPMQAWCGDFGQY